MIRDRDKIYDADVTCRLRAMGYPRQARCAGLAVAERVCGTADRQSRHCVTTGGFPGAIGSVQQGRAIDNPSQGPIADGGGPSLWEWDRRRYSVLLLDDDRQCCRPI